MGRSRAVSRPADDDPSHSRSKRRKTTASNVGAGQAAANTSSIVSGENSEGKAALYHCNYCNKDISGNGIVRIKCAMCPDFDLCVECFSVGAEVTPHKSNHPYRVMENLSFPLICPDWSVDEEMLLLEGIEMYGFGNWTEVSEHVGTKSKSQCIDHYKAVYMSSPCFPLPNMSHISGKSREELLAMAKEEVVTKKAMEAMVKEESPAFSGIKIEGPRKEDLSHKSSILNARFGSHVDSSSSNTLSGSVKKAFNISQGKDGIKVEDSQADRSVGEKKLRISGEEGPSMTEFSGYNFKRQEFEVEYDNDAEQLLADMEFKDTDTDAERELKLRVLRIYNKRLDERKRRKEFILERNLLFPDPFENALSPEEKEIYQRYKVFMRFHSKEEHEQLMKSVIEEQRIIKRIQGLKEARAAGCQTAAEANKFIEQKRKKEGEEITQRVKESTQAGPSGKVLQRPSLVNGEFGGSPRGVVKGPSSLHPAVKDSFSTSTLEDWDITGFPGADLLSEYEKHLCCEMRILPSHYLNMLQILTLEIMKGTVSKKSDAHGLFKVEPSKVDKVYDMLVSKGIAEA